MRAYRRLCRHRSSPCRRIRSLDAAPVVRTRGVDPEASPTEDAGPPRHQPGDVGPDHRLRVGGVNELHPGSRGSRAPLRPPGEAYASAQRLRSRPRAARSAGRGIDLGPPAAGGALPGDCGRDPPTAGRCGGALRWVSPAVCRCGSPRPAWPCRRPQCERRHTGDLRAGEHAGLRRHRAHGLDRPDQPGSRRRRRPRAGAPGTGRGRPRTLPAGDAACLVPGPVGAAPSIRGRGEAPRGIRRGRAPYPLAARLRTGLRHGVSHRDGGRVGIGCRRPWRRWKRQASAGQLLSDVIEVAEEIAVRR